MLFRRRLVLSPTTISWDYLQVMTNNNGALPQKVAGYNTGNGEMGNRKRIGVITNQSIKSCSKQKSSPLLRSFSYVNKIGIIRLTMLPHRSRSRSAL